MQAITATKAPCVRPAVVSRPSVQPRRAVRGVRVFSAPDKAQIEAAIKEAEEACKGNDKGECATAWDTVEELSAAAAHAKAAQPKGDRDGSLTNLCEEDPSADECRVYDD